MGALLAFCAAHGVPLQHVKPHGALYNMAAKDEALAAGIAEGIASVDKNVILLGLAGSKLLSAGRAAGLRVASEVFADRAYQADGSLVPRSKPGAVIHDADEAIARTVRMVKEGKVTAITGEEVTIEAHSICVHGDNPDAVEFVRRIRAKLEAEGEGEYMRMLAEAYQTKDQQEFYEFTRALDALKESLTGDEKTVILDKDSKLGQILMGNH